MKKLLICLFMLVSSYAHAATIRIGVLYSPEATAYFNGDAYREAAINTLISQLNTALSNSGASFNVDYGGSRQFNAQSGAGMTSWFASGYNTQLGLYARDMLRSDVVLMLGNFGCVGTWGAARGGINTTLTRYSAFATIDVCGINQTEWKYTFQHEFAHLLLARHQAAYGTQDNDATGGVTAKGHYSVHRIPNGPNGAWNVDCRRDIMSHTLATSGTFLDQCLTNYYYFGGGIGAPLYLHFSNPNRSYSYPDGYTVCPGCQGPTAPVPEDHYQQPTGTSTHNNMGTMNSEAASKAVHTYRDKPISPISKAMGVIKSYMLLFK